MMINDKAVSQIVGAFLLIMIAIASASVVYLYAPNEVYKMFGSHGPLCDLVGYQTTDSFVISHTGGEALKEYELFANGTLICKGEDFSMGTDLEFPLDHTMEITMASEGHLVFHATFSPSNSQPPTPLIPTEPEFPSGNYTIITNGTTIVEDGQIGSNLLRLDKVLKGEITPPAQYGRCGYIEWELPYMPSNVTITNLEFWYCGEGFDPGGSTSGSVFGKSMEYIPSNSSNATLWADCQNGNTYFEIWKSEFGGGWHYVRWEESDWLYDCRADIIEHAHNGTHWSIGMTANGFGWVMWSCSEQYNIAPYLLIEFTVP